MYSPRAPLRSFAAPLCALLIGLHGCSGGGGDDDAAIDGDGAVAPDAGPEAGMTPDESDAEQRNGLRHGQIIVTELTPPDGPVTSHAVARFVAIDADDAASTALLERSIDTCGTRLSDSDGGQMSDADALPTREILPIDETRVLGAIDAGGTIVLTGPGGTWATLVSAERGDAGVYGDGGASVGIDGRVPSGLTVDISDAGDFPGFAAIAMPDPQPSANTLAPLPGSRVDATTEYRWAANDVTGSRVRISLDTGTGRLDCFAADDGLFTLAEAAGAGLPSGATLLGAWRESTRIERNRAATLVLTVTTGTP